MIFMPDRDSGLRTNSASAGAANTRPVAAVGRLHKRHHHQSKLLRACSHMNGSIIRDDDHDDDE